MISYAYASPLGQCTAVHGLTEVNSDGRGGGLERVCDVDLGRTVYFSKQKGDPRESRTLHL
jgi:hypothetical protein